MIVCRRASKLRVADDNPLDECKTDDTASDEAEEQGDRRDSSGKSREIGALIEPLS